MKSCEYKTGFTLVEMLIVVAIIVILATMVVGLAARIDTQSKERALESTYTLLDAALQEYYEYWKLFPDPNMNPYPTHSAALYGQLNATPTSCKILEKISTKLLRPNPDAPDMQEICDPWGKVLDYLYVTGDTFPKLISSGPDRTFGTADDISNR